MKILLIISILNFIHISAQQKQILDYDTNESIPFATIQFNNDENKTIFSTYSNELGFFNPKLNSTYSTINISCMGYEAITINNNEFNKDIYYLKKNVIELKEVIVSSKDKIKVGYLNNKKTSDKVGVSIGLEVAVYISNDFEYETKINSILFNIRKTNSRVAYRVHLYKPSSDKTYPSIELLNKNNINYIEPNTKGIIEVNLSDYDIIFPKEGIFVGIEGLEGNNLDETFSRNKNNILQFEVHQSDKQIYFEKNTLKRVGWININKWLPEDYLKTFKKEYNKGKLYVPSFGLKLSKIEQ
jgi:hypothetical protein